MKRSGRKILKIAVFIYLASFLIINWNDVSWIFNYRQIGGMISDFFNPYPSIEASSIDKYFVVKNSTNNAQAPLTPAPEIKTTYTENEKQEPFHGVQKYVEKEAGNEKRPPRWPLSLQKKYANEGGKNRTFRKTNAVL
jgi:hypothetical protein